MTKWPTDAEIDAAYPTNTDGDITAAIMRTEQKKLTASGKSGVTGHDATETYVIDDLVAFEGIVYQCILGHTSEAFNLTNFNPSSQIPIGGTTDQVLKKVSDANFDTGWGIDSGFEIQEYTQSTVVLAKAAPGKSYTPGKIVQLRDVLPNPPDDPRFPNWSTLEVDEIIPDAAFDLPSTSLGRLISSTPVYVRWTLNVAGQGVAIKFQVADLSETYGTINWDLVSIAYEAQTSGDANQRNMRFKIYDDNAGVPGNIIVDWPDIDHTKLLELASLTTLALDTPLQVTNGQVFWVVTLFDDLDGSLGSPDTRPGSLTNWLNAPLEWSNISEYLVIPIEEETAKYTSDNGTGWIDDPFNNILRMRATIIRTSALEAPSSMYGMVGGGGLDENTAGTVFLQGPIKANFSGSQFGETWLQNDILYWDPITHDPTNIKPSDPKDVIIVGQVFNNDPIDGTGMITLMTTGVRGVWMASSIYDPNGQHVDAFNLNNMFLGTLASSRITYDNGDSGLVAERTQDAIDELTQRIIALEP